MLEAQKGQKYFKARNFKNILNLLIVPKKGKGNTLCLKGFFSFIHHHKYKKTRLFHFSSPWWWCFHHHGDDVCFCRNKHQRTKARAFCEIKHFARKVTQRRKTQRKTIWAKNDFSFPKNIEKKHKKDLFGKMKFLQFRNNTQIELNSNKNVEIQNPSYQFAVL